jgi:lipopolysaccharide/colanic/teichoic acid biosynthesis glycosyltransferase
LADFLEKFAPLWLLRRKNARLDRLMNAHDRDTFLPGPGLPALVPSFERRRLRIYLSLILADVAAIFIGFLIAGAIYAGRVPAPSAMIQAQLLLPLFLTIALYQGAYSVGSLTDTRYAFSRVLMSIAIAAALLMFVTFYTKFAIAFSRLMFTIGLACTTVLLFAIRSGTIAWIRRRWGGSVTNVLVIDDGGPRVDIPGAYHVSGRKAGVVPDPSDPEQLDRVGRLFVNMDRVIISCPEGRRADWAFVLRASGTLGEVTSERLNDLRPLGVRDNGGNYSLIVSTGPLGMRARVAKRLFDCTVAAAALVVTAPIMLIAAALIKLEDGGPVLFVQRRLGEGNRFFRMLKFRSMRTSSSDADGKRSALRGDERTTRVGRFIRATSIDELPQLINVLKGDMSVVGPRPHAIGSQAGSKLFWEVDGHYWQRHSLKPGLTGLAQIRGLRGATELESDLTDRLQADLEYISSWNLWRDMWIVLKTLGVLVHQKAF